MPKDERAYQYDQQYIKENLIKVLITFNRKKPRDMSVVEWLDAQPAKSTYIKRLIWQDMQAQKKKGSE